MTITKRTHYIPCFWTAFWSSDYYQSIISENRDSLSARDQIVYSLNIRANKIIETKVNSVYYENKLGIAKISYTGALDFCKRYYPNDFEVFKQTSNINDYPLTLDYENIFTGIEHTQAYEVLLEVIKLQNIRKKLDKGLLADFIFLQLLRSPAILNSLIELNRNIGVSKFEYLLLLKSFLSSSDLTYPIVARIGLSHWIFYVTENDLFPLCDTPVLVQPDDIMIAFSPRLMLRVILKKESDGWEVKKGISSELFHDFKKRTILNTYKEIIFSEKHLLEKWQNSKRFLERVERAKKIKTFDEIIRERSQDLWLLNSSVTEKDWLIKAHRNPLFFKK